MTGLQAVTEVAKYIKQEIEGVEVFKYEKPKGYAGEYIAVNNLPFVHKEDIQTCTINVNVHVPKLDTSQPDTRRLEELLSSIISLFDSKYGTFLEGAYFCFYSDSRPTEDQDDTYYINIELECSFENISKE